jgi:very-short-patch-repair endonuclease
VLTYQEALATGLTARAVHQRACSGRWTRVAPAVYVAESSPTTLDRARAAALHGGSDAVVTGQAALAIYGFRVPVPHEELVLVPRSCCARNWGRIRLRRTYRLPGAVWVTDAPLAPVARALADYAVTLRRLPDVQSLVGFAIQQRRCDIAELATELEAGPRRGSRHLREALRDAGYGAHSAPEATAGRLLRAAGIHMGQNVEVALGARRFVADFLDTERRAILEVDSVAHHYSVADQDATLARDQALQAAGYRVLHVKPRQLVNANAFVRLVGSWLSSCDADRES